MTIRIIIGTDEREINDIEPSWISEQIRKRKQDGVPVCVVVKIKSGDLDMALASGGCPSGAPGGRALTPKNNKSLIFGINFTSEMKI